MVKIAIAGGSGNVGQEVVDALVRTKKHEIILLSRKDVSPVKESRPGVTWCNVDYRDQSRLAQALKGVHTVLSFVVTQNDPESQSQKNLIDAAITAGVQRFAPSEWATSNFANLDWYDGKAIIRKYLEDKNKDQKVLEYSLFQPGLFTNYFTYPYHSADHFRPFETQFDFNNRRAIMMEGGDEDVITLTTAQDLANVVALAVEYEGEWPLIGGIKGTDVTVRELINIGQRIRGPFHVEKLGVEDLRRGKTTCSWLPVIDHPGFTAEQARDLASKLLSGMLLGISSGALKVSDEWNQLLPEYRFTQAEEFLLQAWKDKM